MVRRRVTYQVGQAGRAEGDYRLFRKDIRRSIEPVMEEDIQKAAREGFDALQWATPIVSGDLRRSERRTPTGFYTNADGKAPYDRIVEDLYQAGGGRQNRTGGGFMEHGVDVMLEYLRRIGYRGQIRRRGALQIGGLSRSLPRGTRLGAYYGGKSV